MQENESSKKKNGLNLRNRLGSRAGQQTLVIVAFSFIPLLLMFVFTILPLGKMVEFSFFDMGYLGDRDFVGFDNYVEVFQRDDIQEGLFNSLYYILGAFIQIALALYFAVVLSDKATKGRNIFRGFMFFPYLVGGIAVGFIFKFFYTRGFVLDTVLGWLGADLESLPYWLRDTSINNFSLMFSSIWKNIGSNIVLFIGAIQSVDGELYEAASIDGANKWHQFKYITLPGIRTTVVLNLIMAIAGSIKVFEPPYVITGGSFGTSTYLITVDRLAHSHQKVGLASAMSIVLFALIIVVTIIQQRVSKKLEK